MPNTTPFHQQHIAAGAKLVDFAGWEMPIHYGSQIEEHHQVRKDAGMFDVSHMCIVEIEGQNAKAFLRKVLANDVAKLKVPGKALYSCMLNEKGGIIDDLITYYFTETHYRMVVNAATRAQDVAWLKQQANAFQVTISERTDLAMLAVQGPQACAKAAAVFPENTREAIHALKPFTSMRFDHWFVARTGYTGEDGYEIIFPAEQARQVWQTLLEADVRPCGLGARDTLRLEAGLNLYGSDMNASTTPLESNLAWTIAWEDSERDFLGKAALLAQKQAGVAQRLVGLILEGRGVLRDHQKVVLPDGGEGEVTSGSFSPTLAKSIAFARIPQGTATTCNVQIRNQTVPAKIVKVPFVKQGKVVV